MQVLGVYEPRLTELLGKVLMHLGSQHCFVVHGMDGLDEITLTDRTIVSEAKGGVLVELCADAPGIRPRTRISQGAGRRIAGG